MTVPNLPLGWPVAPHPTRWTITELAPRTVADSFRAMLVSPAGSEPTNAPGYEEINRSFDPFLPWSAGEEDTEVVYHTAAVTVVSTTKTWTEDGPSFGMVAEEGWLFVATVEIATGRAAEGVGR
jgi:hypothetical protein